MKKNILILAIVAAVLLAGCGGTPATTSTVSAPTAAPTVAQTTGEKITLRLWSHSGPAFQEANKALIDKFAAQNPNITVKYETFDYDTYIQNLQTSMAAGTEADVIEMFGTWTCSYANGGRLAPVPTDVMTYDQAQQIYYKAPLDGYYCGGKLYGLPQEFNLENGGAVVNPELFQKHGVPYPPQWKTFADLVADAKKMTEFDAGKMTRAGFHFTSGDGIAFTFLAGILEQGGSYFAADGKHFNFDSKEARKIAQLMVDLAQKEKVVDPVLFNNDANQDIAGTFYPGNVAIGFVGSWAAGEARSMYPDKKYDYAQIPTYFGGERRFAADSGWGKVVSVNTKHPAEAWQLAKFMAVERDNAELWNADTGTIPAQKAIVSSPDKLLEKSPWIKPTFGLLQYGQFIGDVTDRDKLFYDIIYQHILNAMQGNESVDDAVTAINTEANAMVDEKK